MPVPIEIMGVWGPDAMEFLAIQRGKIAIQRGNAISVFASTESGNAITIFTRKNKLCPCRHVASK